MNLLSARGATTGASSFLISGCVLEDSPSTLCSSFFCSALSSVLSFFPSRPPKMEARLPRETERDLDLAFFAFFSSSDEELEDEPARAGAATMASSAAGASVVSAGFVVASVLFLGVEAVAAASVVGLPTRCQPTAELTGPTRGLHATRTRSEKKLMHIPIFSFCSLYPSLDSIPSLASFASAMAFSTATNQLSRSGADWASKVCLWPEIFRANAIVPSLWRSVAYACHMSAKPPFCRPFSQPCIPS